MPCGWCKRGVSPCSVFDFTFGFCRISSYEGRGVDDDAIPIIGIDIGIFGVVITVDVELAPNGRRPVGTGCIVDTDEAIFRSGGSGRSRLVIVVYHVYGHTFGAIATVTAPIVDDVVAHIGHVIGRST